MIMKTCGKCRAAKPIDQFYIDRQRGLPKSYCKQCNTLAQREWRQSRPNYESDRYRRQKSKERERTLVRKYDVDLAAYGAMLAKQNGQCAICGCDEGSQHNGVFHVDHCHVTGVVRGLLCRGCNHVLGHLRDDPEALANAIVYLLRSPVPQIPEAIGRAILRVEAAMLALSTPAAA